MLINITTSRYFEKIVNRIQCQKVIADKFITYAFSDTLNVNIFLEIVTPRDICVAGNHILRESL